MNVENKGSIDLTRSISVGKQCNISPHRRPMHEPGCVLDPAVQTWASQAAHWPHQSRPPWHAHLLCHPSERSTTSTKDDACSGTKFNRESLKRQSQSHINRSFWFGLVLKFHIATMDLVMEDRN